MQGKKGQHVWTDGKDEEALSRGVFDTYVKRNLRYSQARGAVGGRAPRLAPDRHCVPRRWPPSACTRRRTRAATCRRRLSCTPRRHVVATSTRVRTLPASLTRRRAGAQGNEYHFHFMAKGGGSANKTFLYQETKARASSATRDARGG